MKIHPARQWNIVFFTAIITLVSITVNVQAETDLERRSKTFNEIRKECRGKYRSDSLSKTRINLVLDLHKKWNEIYSHELYTQKAQKNPDRANLCGTDLEGIDLSRSYLNYADLSAANLSSANLSYVNFEKADLRSAVLTHTNLRSAILSDANLREAYLAWADMQSVFLNDSDLSGADLHSTNLADAQLDGTDLNGSNLYDAELSGVLFEPSKLPDIDSIALANNLSKMVYSLTPQPLVKLRNAFKNAGFRTQERAITYAIKRSELMNRTTFTMPGEIFWINWVESGIQYILFDLTTAWGMAPGRALMILLCLIPIFSIPYIYVLSHPGKDGIWRIWNDGRMRKDLGTEMPTRLKEGGRVAIALGLYFSLLSAFHIGWRDFNVGNWVTRLQAREYTLSASGWVRTISGVQSLLSVYLLAIWVITHFGRPFE